MPNHRAGANDRDEHNQKTRQIQGVQPGSGQEREAAAKGWTAWERVEAEPLLAKMRRDPRYAEILARMRR